MQQENRQLLPAKMGKWHPALGSRVTACYAAPSTFLLQRWIVLNTVSRRQTMVVVRSGGIRGTQSVGGRGPVYERCGEGGGGDRSQAGDSQGDAYPVRLALRRRHHGQRRRLNIPVCAEALRRELDVLMRDAIRSIAIGDAVVQYKKREPLAWRWDSITDHWRMIWLR